MVVQALFIALAGFNVFYFGRMAVRKARKRAQFNVFEPMVDTHQLEHVYTGEDGSKVYSFKNPARMPANRSIAAEIAVNQASQNITRESLLAFIQAAEEAANNGQVVEAFKYLARIKDRLMWAAEEQTLTNLANCYLMLEGENPEVMEPKHQEAKKQLMARDPKAKAFFLHTALNYTSDFSAISPEDILKYLTLKRQEENPVGQ